MMINFFNLINISRIQRIQFRKDINGLRAIAVLAVVFYHAEIELFKGGWLGVDIFFVISGYLISNIIISELNEQSFTLKNFYLKRVRRILPALFSTLFLIMPFAYFLLTPKALKEYADSMLASIFFFSNYHFQNLDFYIAESTKFMPLLHTWSLAIEEQYYLLFPIFSIFLYRYFKKYFTLGIVFMILVSIYLNSLTQEIIKFYQLQFRIWELLLGVLVMIVSSNLQIKNLEKIGIPLLLLPFFFFDDSWINDIEPKMISLVGMSLIIFSNTEKTFLTKILSFKLLSIIGLSSYSIYLFHQPIFAFFRISQSVATQNNLTFVMLVVILLGYLNYIFVEKIFLNKNVNIISLKTVIPMSFIFIFMSLSLYTNGDLYRNLIKYKNFANIELLSYSMTPFYDEEGCLNSRRFCRYTQDENFTNIIVLGDSMATSFSVGLLDNIENYDYNLIENTKGGCPYLIDLSLSNRCYMSYQNERTEYLKNVNNSIILLMGNFQAYMQPKNLTITVDGISYKGGEPEDVLFVDQNNNIASTEQVKESFIKTIESLATNNEVVIFYPYPYSVINPKDFYEDRGVFLKYELIEYLNFNQEINEIINDLNISNLTKIDLTGYFCGEIYCEYDNKFDYKTKDSIHLTFEMASNIARNFFEDIDKKNN